MTTTTTLSMMVGAPTAAPPGRAAAGVTPADVAEGFAMLLARVGHAAEPVEEAPEAATTGDAGAEPSAPPEASESSEPSDESPAVAAHLPGAPTAPAAPTVPVVATVPVEQAATASLPSTPAPGSVPEVTEPLDGAPVRPDDTATSPGPDRHHVPSATTLPGVASGAAPADAVRATTSTEASPDTGATAGATVAPDTVTPDTVAPEPAVVDAAAGTDEPTAPRVRAVEPPQRGRGDAAGPPAPDVVADGGEPSPAGPRPALVEAGTRASEVASPVAIDRVMRAVEALENAPPPRRMTFDVDGVRVAVSLTGREVAVELGGDRRLPPDLVRALADRGFDLAGQSDRHGTRDGDRAPTRRWRDDPPAPQRRPRSVPAPAADDLRL